MHIMSATRPPAPQGKTATKKWLPINCDAMRRPRSSLPRSMVGIVCLLQAVCLVVPGLALYT